MQGNESSRDNLLNVTMAKNDLMLMMVESVMSKKWPNGLAYVIGQKLFRCLSHQSSCEGRADSKIVQSEVEEM